MMHARWGDYYMIDKTYSICCKELPYLRNPPSAINTFILNKAKYKYVPTYLHILNSQSRLLQEFRSEKPDGFGILRAFLKKSAGVYSSHKFPKSWGVTKKIIWAHYIISFRFFSFLLIFNSSGRNFVSAAGGCEILHEF